MQTALMFMVGFGAVLFGLYLWLRPKHASTAAAVPAYRKDRFGAYDSKQQAEMYWNMAAWRAEEHQYKSALRQECTAVIEKAIEHMNGDERAPLLVLMSQARKSDDTKFMADVIRLYGGKAPDYLAISDSVQERYRNSFKNTFGVEMSE